MKFLTVTNIHGRFTEWAKVMDRLSDKHDFLTFDKIILLGDYIVYGKESVKVAETLVKMHQTFPNVVILKGNWEHFLWQVVRGTDKKEVERAKFFFSQYKQWDVVKDFRLNKSVLNDFLDLIEKMPNYYTAENVIFSHAGIDFMPYLEALSKSSDGEVSIEDVLKKTDPEAFLMDLDFPKRAESFFEEGLGDVFPYHVIYGQTAINKINGMPNETKYTKPHFIGKTISVDFGALYSKGRIGAVVFEPDGSYETFYEDILPLSKVKEAIALREAKKSSPKPAEKMPTKKEITTTEKKVSLKENKSVELVSYDLFKEGKKLTEIAKISGLKVSSVANHLVNLYKKNYDVPIEKFFRPENEEKVIDAAIKLKTVDLKEIKKAVPEAQYFEIEAIFAKHKIS